MTDVELIKLAVEFVNRGGMFMLDSPVGAMELHGQDLYLSESGGWLAIYHREEPSGEARSHLHLKTGVLKTAQIVKEEEQTPYLGFWQDEDKGDPILRAYYPSFYDWSNNKASIKLNRIFFEKWEQKYGFEFLLK